MSSRRFVRVLVVLLVVIQVTLGVVVLDRVLPPSTEDGRSTHQDSLFVSLLGGEATAVGTGFSTGFASASATTGSTTPTPTGGGGTGTPTDGSTPTPPGSTPTPSPGETPTPSPPGSTPTSSPPGSTPTPSPPGTTPTPTPPGTTPTPTLTPTEPVEGEPDLDAFAPNNTVSPGQRTRFVVQLTNSGTVDEGGLDTPPDAERLVTTARNLRVTLDDDGAPIAVRTDTVALGDLPSGSITQAGFDIVVDEDADPGVYDLDVTVEYDYTSLISGDERDDESETETFSVTLVVTENARFEVVDVESDLQVGEQGTVELTLENVGEESVRDAAVTIRSRNADLLVDTGGETVRFVGDWDDGDEQTVTFQVTALNTSAPQEYALEAVVSYTDSDGVPRESFPLSFGVQPDEEQSFSLDDLEGDLRVGEDGTVTGTITNDGPGPVADATVRLVDQNGDVVALRSTAVLGDLDAGESADFSFPVRVAGAAKPGDRQLSLVVEYLNSEGDPRRSAPLRGTVGVEEKRDRFEIRTVEADVQAGETGTVTVRIANVGDEDLTDAVVILSSPDADLQLDSGGNASRFVGEWDAGDVEQVEFEATAANDTGGQRFPLEVTVVFTDSDGDRRRSAALVTELTPEDEQRFTIRDVTDTLRIGEEGRVTGTVRNTGPQRVSTAVVRLTSTDENLSPRETEAVLGNLRAGESADFSLPVSVFDTAQPGERRLTFVVEYEDADGDRRRSDPISVIVDVSSESDRFVVRSIRSNLQADNTGTVVLTLTNRGNQTLSDATVSLASTSRQLLVGNGVNDTRFVGDWPGGANRTVRYRVRAANGTGNQTFAFRAFVNYEDDEDQSRRSGPLAFGLTPAREQAFAVQTVDSTLRVAEEGRVTVRLTNRGPAPVSGVAVLLVTEAPTVNPVETEVAVGPIDPGASRTVSFPVEITESAEEGTRQFTYRVRYTDADGDRRRSDSLTADVRVAPKRDAFVVDAEEVNVTVGQDGTVTVVITNNRGVPLRNIQAKAFADAPISVDDDQAFVTSLAPNESTTIQFTVSAGSDAGTKTYPLSIDFLYTLPDGDQRLSDPFDVGVTVVEAPANPLLDLALPLLVVVLLVLLALWLLRRRRRRRSAREAEDASTDAEGTGDEAGAAPGEGTSGASGDDSRTDDG
jgi:hypothetical protein